MTKTNHPFIVGDSNIRGNHPVITGTSIRVIDIAIEYKGYSIDQIIDYHPHLELKHIHDALSYYYENQELFDHEIKADRLSADEIRKELLQKFTNSEPKHA